MRNRASTAMDALAHATPSAEDADGYHALAILRTIARSSVAPMPDWCACAAVLIHSEA